MRKLYWTTLLVFVASTARPDDWPQWMGPQRDGVWRESGIVEKLPEDGPTVRWRTPIGAGYAGPAVVGDQVYVSDRVLNQGAANPDNPFSRGAIPGNERLICLDDATGEILWKHEYKVDYTVSYAAGPRATPTIHGDRAYFLGAEGHLHCLNTADGDVIWKKHFGTAFNTRTPLWGFAASPLFYDDQVICLVGSESEQPDVPDAPGVVAFDAKTGETLWTALTPSEPGYCPPILFEKAGETRLLVWNPDGLYAMNPKTGEVHWEYPWQIRSGLTVPVPRLVDDRIFLTCFYNGSALLQRKPDGSGVVELWKSPKPSEKDTTYLHSIISTPVLYKDHIYGCCSYGQFRCLQLEDGKRLWESMAFTTNGEEARWGNAFIVQHDDRFFLFNERGELLIANLAPDHYEIISRAQLVEPNGGDMRQRNIVWSHPAFAHKNIYVRNDSEIASFSLAE